MSPRDILIGGECQKGEPPSPSIVIRLDSNGYGISESWANKAVNDAVLGLKY